MKNAVSVPYLMLILFPLISCVRNVPETAVQESPESPVISNDISNNRVTAFAEDAHGHIWIGTFRGLNKSTVHEYHQYFCTGDTLSIPDNQVQALYRDSGGRLWVATVNGVCRYTDKDNFRRMNLDSDNNNVVQFLEDKSGRLFVTNAESLYMWNEQSGRFSPVISRLDNERMFYCRCFMGSADDIWVVNSSEIRCYGGNPIQLKMSVKLRNPEPYASFMADGKLWLCSYNGIEVFDTGTRRYVDSPFASHPVLGNAYISLIYSLGNGTLLVNTGNDGLYCYNGNTGSICGQNDAGFPFSAPSFKINTVFKDSEDNIWLGSYDQAFSVIYNYKERFNSDSFLRSAFEDVSVYSTDCDSSGNLWITTLRGELYVYGPGGLKKMDSFPGIRIVCAGTGDDHVWLATFGSVIHCRYVSGSLHKLAEFPVPMPISLSLGEDGTLWVGVMGGTVYAVREGKVSASAPVSPSYTFVSDILPLEDGKMLAAAFREGLLEFMPDASGFSEAGIHEDDWDACIRRSVFVPTCLFRDSYGDIWVGTVANGLLRYSPSSGKMAPVPGAPCTDICSIEEDFHGNLWVSTQYGLGKYDRSVEKFINWHTADGIGGNQFYDRSSCRLPDGTIVFGGTHGLTVFNPVDVMPERDLSVCFENLKVHNVLVRPSPGGCIDRSMPHNPDVCLDYRQNSFSISFTALEYGEYERVGYFYMMEGFDNYWIDAGNNREACYANLPPGKYRFKVRITDNDRNAVLAENSVHVRVRPPLWLSWWALSSYVFFIGMIAWGLLRMRRQVLEEKKAREKEVLEKMQEKKVNEMNMSFFANISHEFRTPLTMISGPVAQLRGSDSICVEDKRLLDIVQRNIKRMLRLVNQLLDFNKLENDTLKLHVRLLDIIPQLRELAEIFRVTAQEKEIVFKAYGLEDSLTVWADDDKLDKICFNLLSNAMKFTSSGGKVELSLDVISREDAMAYFSLGDSDIDCRYVKIAVRDSGPGIPADQRERIFERYYQLENQVRGAYNWGTGIGLYFAKMLAIMHHGHIKAEGRDGMPGAEFILLLPASEISYSVDEKVPQGGGRK